MIPKLPSALFVIIVICTLALGGAAPGTTPVYAAQEDVALFQAELSRYGQWLNHGQHGQVWRPTQVNRNWRPYTNGRWVPSQEGYVFETDEPWGWATYHYGNWITTKELGWVWVPGRTWYPHTVNWRTNDQNVGWAPVPPPENTASDNYFSGGYSDGDYTSPTGMNSYGSSMYGISPSSWNFTRASDFLLGYGQPYASSYSYANAGMLAAPQYIPVIYERTVYVNNYVSPRHAPRACYNWGPPVPYLTKVTNIKNIEIDHRYKDLRHAHLRNVMPPANLAHRHPGWREILPGDGETRQRSIRSVANNRTAAGGLNRPDAIPAPLSLNRRPAETSAPNGVPGPGNTRPPINQASVTTPQQPPENRNARRNPAEYNQVTRPPEQSRGPHSSRLAVTNSPTSGTAGRTADPSLANPSAPSAASSTAAAKQLPPVTQPPRQAHRGYQRDEPQASQEGQLRRHQEQRLRQDQQRAEQEVRMRQQQRLDMERQQQQARACQTQQQQQARSQQHLQEEQQRRQAEMQRQQQMQQMQQQQRQAEMQQAQQMQQQQRQAEMQRAQQIQQQQQAARQAPPPPQRQAPPPQRQKKQDNQNQ